MAEPHSLFAFFVDLSIRGNCWHSQPQLNHSIIQQYILQVKILRLCSVLQCFGRILASYVYRRTFVMMTDNMDFQTIYGHRENLSKSNERYFPTRAKLPTVKCIGTDPRYNDPQLQRTHVPSTGFARVFSACKVSFSKTFSIIGCPHLPVVHAMLSTRYLWQDQSLHRNTNQCCLSRSKTRKFVEE